VRGLRIFDPLLKGGAIPVVAGRTVRDVRRSGKRVLIELSPRESRREGLWLAVHLRMTGRLTWVDESVPVERAHLRARFRLDRGSLLFHDTRRFGTMDWFGSLEETEPGGVDPLSRGLTARKMETLIGGSSQNVKAWLLRQDRLVGLGNIYASEILFVAGISPLRAAGSLTAAERERLLRATRQVLRRAIRNCGTTVSDFQDARGLTGTYQRFLKVYGREDDPCDGCGAPVVRLVQQQRSTFYCAHCQH
jgi:formamidopyrimidine-DNA glycosylase